MSETLTLNELQEAYRCSMSDKDDTVKQMDELHEESDRLNDKYNRLNLISNTLRNRILYAIENGKDFG